MKVIASVLAAVVSAVAAGEDCARWADPFIGTDGVGHTVPNACRPFGMVQAGPSSGTCDWKYCGGYQYGDTELYGFVQDALSGTGCPDLGDIRLQPFAGEGENAARTARKADERAEPGYYAVTYPRQGITCEVTATRHVGFYRFRFGKDARAKLLVDLQWGHCDYRRYANHVRACETSFEDKNTMTGHLRLKEWVERDVYFVLAFSRPFADRDTTENGRKTVLDFGADGELLVKVALSRTSVAAARANLAAEASDWDFAQCRSEAYGEWNDFLSRIRIEGDAAHKRSFYTALYHLAIAPNDISDAGEAPFYSTLSTWDTFRAAHPLFTLIAPERVPGMVDSILRQGERTGYLPIWSLWGEENQCMVGTHSIPILVDAYLKGFPGDWEGAWRQVRDTLKKSHPGRVKEGWDLLDRYGYYPFDRVKGESVSRLLEGAYDDWCAGILAEKFGTPEEARFFFDRSRSWRNVLDAETGFMRGRDAAGAWREPFDPFELGHGDDLDNDYTEGNAFQYTWHVLHEPEALIAAVGGRAKFVERLDAFFAQPEKTEGRGCVVDVTGLIGQYAHGNEPSHHVAYLYTLAGRPDRTAEVVREVCDRFYRTAPDGLSGNDDCGQMSAWYVFACLGFYPLNPCGGDYVLGAPQVERAEVKVKGEGGQWKTFAVLAPNLSEKNKYVKTVTLNGKPMEGCILRHADILKGGELVFEMTDHPEHHE